MSRINSGYGVVWHRVGNHAMDVSLGVESGYS